MLQTLKHSMQILEFVKSKGIEVKFHGRTKNEASHYCGQCEVIRKLCNQCVRKLIKQIFPCFWSNYRSKFSTFSLFASKRSVTWFIVWAVPGSNRRRFKALSAWKSTSWRSWCRSTTPSCSIDRHLSRCLCRHHRKPLNRLCNNSKSHPSHKFVQR